MSFKQEEAIKIESTSQPVRQYDVISSEGKSNREFYITNDDVMMSVNLGDMYNLIIDASKIKKATWIYDIIITITTGFLTCFGVNFYNSKDLESLVIAIVLFCVIIVIMYKRQKDNRTDINNIHNRISEICNRQFNNRTQTISRKDMFPNVIFDGNGNINYKKTKKLFESNKKLNYLEKSNFLKIIPLAFILLLPCHSIAYQIALFKPNEGANYYDTIFVQISVITVVATLSLALYSAIRYRKIKRALSDLTNNLEALKNRADFVPENKDSEELFKAGKNLLSNGDIFAAINTFSEAIIINPEQKQYYECRAEAFRIIGDLKKSQNDYEKALKLSKDCPSHTIRILHKLATLIFDTGNVIAAEHYYEKAYKILNENETIELKASQIEDITKMLNDYGNFLLSLNKLAEAESVFEKTLYVVRHVGDKFYDTRSLKAKTMNNFAKVQRKKWRYDLARTNYEKALKIYRTLAEDEPDKYLDEIAIILNNLGNLSTDTKRYSEAVNFYNESLIILKNLSAQNHDIYISDIATTLNNMATLHSDTNNHTEAETEYQEALEIRRQLAEKNPDAFLPDVATTLNNLANLHNDTNKHTEAETEYKEALEIYRQLAEKNPDAFLPDVAMTLNNLANLHRVTNKHTEAEKVYKEALEIRRQLAENNPDAFLPDVATTLNNLAALHYYTNNHTEAETEYQEALKIRRQLAENNPDAFLPDVAMTLNNLANLHSNTNNHTEAEKEYQEALKIRRQLAENNPDAFLPDVATTLNNLAVLHNDTNKHTEAEKEYQEALEIRRQLAENNPDAFQPYVAMTLYNLAVLHIEQGLLEKAKQEAMESFEIYKRFAEISPEAFNGKVEKAKQLLKGASINCLGEANPQ